MRVERSSAKLYSNGEQKQPFQRTCRAQHNERLLGIRGIYVTKVMGVQNFGHLCLGALYIYLVHCICVLHVCKADIVRSVKIISSSLAAHFSTKSKASEKDGTPASLASRLVEDI